MVAFGKRQTGVGREQGTAFLVTPVGTRRLSSAHSDNAPQSHQRPTPCPSP